MSKIIIVEGPDGVGKSTLVKNWVDYLNAHEQYRATHIRQPGGTVGAEYIRMLLLDDSVPLSSHAQMALFAASRYEVIDALMTKEKVLDEDHVFIVDRWSLSTEIYQSGLAYMRLRDKALDLNMPTICALELTKDYLVDAKKLSKLTMDHLIDRFKLFGVEPDIEWVILNASDEILDARLGARNTSDRYENNNDLFTTYCREMYRSYIFNTAHTAYVLDTSSFYDEGDYFDLTALLIDKTMDYNTHFVQDKVRFHSHKGLLVNRVMDRPIPSTIESIDLDATWIIGYLMLHGYSNIDVAKRIGLKPSYVAKTMKGLKCQLSECDLRRLKE